MLIVASLYCYSEYLYAEYHCCWVSWYYCNVLLLTVYDVDDIFQYVIIPGSAVALQHC
jgi:hypothetical protein